MQEIRDLIRENRFSEVKQLLEQHGAVDIADLLDDDSIDNRQILIVFRLLKKDIAADVFSYLDKDRQQYLISSLTDREANSIINSMFVDDAVDLMEELPANVVKKLLKNVDPTTRKEINELLQYPENSAGSLMTTEFADLKQEMTVAAALDHIKKTGVDKETINTCYVISWDRKLDGTVELRHLILADETDVIRDIMNRDVVSVTTLDDQEIVAEKFKKYDLLSMPVVDREKRLVGIITIDDIVDIIDQEATEDFHKMAAVSPSDEDYLKASAFSLAKHRILWLLILMISATFTSSIIKSFDGVLSASVLLAAYIPMLMDTGGNAGSQVSTTVIRALALGEIHPSDWLRVTFKEFRVSLLVGTVLAVVNFGKLMLFDRTPFMIAVVVCLSMMCTIIVSKIVGATLPILAKTARLDPALMASPMITTIVDAVSLTIYFLLACQLLSIVP